MGTSTTLASPPLVLLEAETQALIDWAEAVQGSEDTFLQKYLKLATRLGAHYREDGITEFGFWTPELAGQVIQSERDIFLEIFTPLESVRLRKPSQSIRFRRDRVKVMPHGEFVWCAIAGLQPGRRDQLGSLYWLRFIDPEGHPHILRDVLSYSRPYGVFAPPELYDMGSLERDRLDLDYFRQTGVPQVAELGLLGSDLDEPPPRVPAPTAILQVHVKTASPEGTLEGLTRILRHISDKLAAGREELTPAESAYVGYDAIQLLPVEPTIEYRREDDNRPHEFFSLPEGALDTDWSNVDWEPAEFAIELRKPTTQNWGYDVPIIGSGATNPSVLGSLRPDEVTDFVATLHNFSTGPIQLIYDLVYGHADNQAIELLPRQFFKGPNMYGQDLNHQLPMVRAILLEMQRRKINTGADGIRVDGGQDFRFFNPLSGRVEQDDAYLLAMANVIQTIGNHQRLMFTIFEDGRPWPQPGWEESSTYRDLIELMPESYQWGPLIFAHNTPALKGFWDRKWERVSQVMFEGDRWITGCGNHDTVRRGNQIDPSAEINWHLGDTLPEVIRKAYDNPATKLWVYGFSPGLPMDFLNANLHAAWGFFRNTDDRYGVKVASEEVGFLRWQVTPERYEEPTVFPRLKALGIEHYDFLLDFCDALNEAMIDSDYELEVVAQIGRDCLGEDQTACRMPNMGRLFNKEFPEFLRSLDVPKLKAFAMAFMEDGHDFCNVVHWQHDLTEGDRDFSLAVRRFRAEHPWVRENLSGLDRFNRIGDDERTLFYGWRTNPEDPDDQIVLLCHMGGEPVNATLGDWLQLDLSEWELALATPGLAESGVLDDLRYFSLADSEGVLLKKHREPADSSPNPNASLKITTTDAASYAKAHPPKTASSAAPPLATPPKPSPTT
jgi:hypothetical protein